MKQEERIINDINDCLRFYNLGQFSRKATIESINHITRPCVCDHCVYNLPECEHDDTKTCADGWAKYLESEA